jgi:hypothetical protein
MLFTEQYFYIVIFGTEKLHYLYSSPIKGHKSKSRKTKWVQHIACMQEMKVVYEILVRKYEGKRPFGRPRHR